ncbi:MAG: ABC transporter permease [Hyphomicrobiales bacterium]
MNSLFGLSMTYIAIACVIITAAIFLFVGFIAVRNPVMFKMGIRNIPRRPAQTALIVVGLMLSTLIMSAAFGTGDTLTSSVTNEVYRIAGEADELIVWDANKQAAPQDQQVIPLSEVDSWQQQLANDPDIEAIAPFLNEQLPVQDTRTRLNEAMANIVAFRTEDMPAFGGLKDVDGNDVGLGPGEIAVNKDLAENLDARVGDKLLLFYHGQPVEFTVKALTPNSVLSGALNTGQPEGAAITFGEMMRVTGQGATADAVAVSNAGGPRSGADLSDRVAKKLETVVGDKPYEVQTFKQDALEFAELFGNAFTTIFVVFGLFSIAAGVLLIFLIFVMLAAERKPEMGMARAVGAKRRQLVESFLAEGMGYDLGAALVGLVAGLGVTMLMVQIIKSAAGDNLGLDLEVNFTPRSMIVAFCLGVMATFLVIFISSWRASRLNITAAIRDLPESRPINPESATARGYLRAVLNGLVALALPVGLTFLLLGPAGAILAIPMIIVGLISPWFYLLRGANVARDASHRVEGEGIPRWPWILGIVLPVVGWFFILPWYFIAVGLVRFVRDRKPATMRTWLVILGLIVSPVGFAVALLQDTRARIGWSVGVATAFAIAGLVMTYAGLDRNSSFFFFLGVSLIFFWIAVTLRYFAIAERLAFTVTSAVLLLLWYLPSEVYEPIFGPLNGDIEMFFLSGMVMVTAAVFIVVYNADIVLPALAGLGGRFFGRILPALKTGVAHPLTARFRTGMTMIMIGLIMFSLVMMATMNHNFSNAFLNDDTRGGWDDVIDINSNNTIPDIRAALSGSGTDASKVEAAGELRATYPWETEVENRDQKKTDGEVKDFLRYTVYGANEEFLQNANIKIKTYADGYNSQDAVVQAMLADPTLALLPASVFGQDGFGPPQDDDMLTLDKLDKGFQPFQLTLRDPGTGKTSQVTVIGVMDESADTFLQLGTQGMSGIITGKQTVVDTFPDSKGQRYYLKLTPDTDAEEYAKSVEAGLVQASADSLDKLLDEQQAIQNGFLLVFQGFMGLGLIVGIAALGVVASRAVVERRQQIGMLRAIGYQRGMVALSFLFESGFIALSGILIGLVLGLSLAWVLFTTGDVGDEIEGQAFVVPWLNIAIICAIAFGASMLMTFLPARSASRVPVAEALRYE